MYVDVPELCNVYSITGASRSLHNKTQHTSISMGVVWLLYASVRFMNDAIT